MKKYLLPLICLSFLFGCDDTEVYRYTVEVTLGSEFNSEEEVAEVLAILHSRIGHSGTVGKTEQEGRTAKISFNTPLERESIAALLTTPGRFGFSPVYNIGELESFLAKLDNYISGDTTRNWFSQAINPPEYWNSNDILIGLVGSRDRDRVKELLETRPVKGFMPAQGEPVFAWLPDGDSYRLYMLRSDPQAGIRWNDHVSEAKVNRRNDPGELLMTFDETGREEFARLTGENLHRHLAILLDGSALSVPMVQMEIDGGRASVTGYFDPGELDLIAAYIVGGELTIPVEIISLTETE